MAAVATNPTSPVPLDTIPITPHGETAGQENGDVGSGGRIITVLEDSENFNVKHPLAHTWTLWFTKPPRDKADDWNELLKEIISFDSVEEFWGIYNNISPVSELPVKADYHLFKKGVPPKYEDSQNSAGGKWAYTTRERKNFPIDKHWLSVVLAAIGEQLDLENVDEVMGVVCNVRKGFYRIGLWTRTVGAGMPKGKDGKNGDGNTIGWEDKEKDLEEEMEKAQKKIEELKKEGKKPEPQAEAAVRACREFKNQTKPLILIGENFKKALEVGDTEQIDFTGHKDSERIGSTRAKSKYII